MKYVIPQESLFATALRVIKKALPSIRFLTFKNFNKLINQNICTQWKTTIISLNIWSHSTVCNEVESKEYIP